MVSVACSYYFSSPFRPQYTGNLGTFILTSVFLEPPWLKQVPYLVDSDSVVIFSLVFSESSFERLQMVHRQDKTRPSGKHQVLWWISYHIFMGANIGMHKGTCWLHQCLCFRWRVPSIDRRIQVNLSGGKKRFFIVLFPAFSKALL